MKPMLLGAPSNPRLRDAQPFRLRDEEAGPDELAFDPNVYDWTAPYLDAMALSAAPAISLDRGVQLFSVQGFPVKLCYKSPNELLSAVKTAIAGQSVKNALGATWPSPAANTSVDLGAVPVFGVVVRIADNELNYKYPLMRIDLMDGATLQWSTYVKPRSRPTEFMMLSIQNNGSDASVVVNNNPIIRVQAVYNTGLTPDSTQIEAETLNARDVANVTVLDGRIRKTLPR